MQLRTTVRIAALTALAGCAETSESWQDTVYLEGLHTLEVRGTERGVVAVRGGGEPDQLDLSISRWGRGGTGRAAKTRRSGVDWTVTGGEGVLVVDATSPFRRAGVDVRAQGPTALHVAARVDKGEVHLEGVHGDHLITAERIVGEGVHGQVDLLATRHGLEISLFPDLDSFSLLESLGDDLILRLPEGLPYEIELVGDPAFGVSWRDLGFDEVFASSNYLYAKTGEGGVRIIAAATRGRVLLFGTNAEDEGTAAPSP